MFEHVEGIRRKNRRGALPAAGVAAVVHVLLIVLLAWGVRSRVLLAVEPTGTGPNLGFPEEGGGGGGGGQEVVSYVDVAAPAPEETVLETVPEEDELIPPEPTPVPEPPKEEAPKTETPQVAPPAPAAPNPGQGAGTGGGEGPGQGPGEGSGVGPGSGSGRGGGDGSGNGNGRGPGDGGGSGRIRMPQTDVLFIWPERPRGVARQTRIITLRVDTRGQVRDARLDATTGNRGYDERLRRWAMQLVFRPAVDLDTNRPIEVDYPITVEP